MLFLGGCATRLGNNVACSVMKTFYHTTLDILRMMGVKNYALICVDDLSVYGCHQVVVDLSVCTSVSRNSIWLLFSTSMVKWIVCCCEIMCKRRLLRVDLVVTMKVSLILPNPGTFFWMKRSQGLLFKILHI